MRNLQEPLFHSGITDELPEDHPLAWVSQYCRICGTALHIGNECMSPWFECSAGAYCPPCWFAEYDKDTMQIERQISLPDPEFAAAKETPETAWQWFAAESRRIGISADEMLWRFRRNEWMSNLREPEDLAEMLPFIGDREPESEDYPRYP